MKLIKLIGVFVAIVAIIVGISLISRGSGIPESPRGSDNREKLRQQIDSLWRSDGEAYRDWNEVRYSSLNNKIQQEASVYHEDYADLVEMNTQLAIDCVEHYIFAEWNKAGCSSQRISTYRKALDTIQATDPTTSKTRQDVLLRIKRVCKCYWRARGLAYNKFDQDPDFQEGSWTPYKTYAEKFRNEVYTVTQDSVYANNLKKINELTQGLANDAVNCRLELAEKNYYTRLWQQIKKVYSTIPPEERTREQLNTLRDIRERYNKECDEHTLLDLLCTHFLKDVQNNESVTANN
jgi:hypothetical protein